MLGRNAHHAIPPLGCLVSQPASELPRSISTVGALSIVVGSMLGVGVFLAPAIIADVTHAPLAYLGYWLVGGLTALAGAMSFAELGTMMPRSGGEYAFLRRAFGPSVAVAAGWTLVLVVFPGSIAAMSVAVSEYQLLPALVALRGDDFAHPHLVENLVSTCLIAVFTVLNVAGARLSSRAQTVLTTAPLAILLLVACAGLLWAPAVTPDPTVLLPHTPTTSPWQAFAVSFMATYFAYSGWNAVGYVAGEVNAPARNVPRALLLGTAVVTALYLLLAAFFLKVLGLHQLPHAPEAGSAAVSAWLGPHIGVWMSVPIALGVLSSVNGTVLGGARISFALAEDRLLPPRLATISPRSQSPSAALWLQAAVSVLLVWTGAFDELLMLTSLTMLVIGAASVSALLALRRKEPNTLRPFTVPLYPWTPLLYLAGSGFVIAAQCWMAIEALAARAEDSLRHIYILVGFAAFAAIILVHSLWLRLKSERSSSKLSS